ILNTERGSRSTKRFIAARSGQRTSGNNLAPSITDRAINTKRGSRSTNASSPHTRVNALRNHPAPSLTDRMTIRSIHLEPRLPNQLAPGRNLPREVLAQCIRRPRKRLGPLGDEAVAQARLLHQGREFL